MGEDWNPALYGRFRGLRLRPALDLLAQVPELPPGAAVDLGCGDGVVGPALRARFAGRELAGVDASPAMLERAAARGIYDSLVQDDAAAWRPQAAPALVFSNACLQWLPDHGSLFPALAALLPPGGVLAVQMPRQEEAPSHALMREIAADLLPGRFPAWRPKVAEPADYEARLAPAGAVDIWETEYLQRLEPVSEGHPVRAFTASTAMRPLVEAMSAAERAAFLAAYDAALEVAYPRRADGSVLFPFRRLFLLFIRC